MLVVLRPEAEHKFLEAQTWYGSKALEYVLLLMRSQHKLHQ